MVVSVTMKTHKKGIPINVNVMFVPCLRNQKLAIPSYHTLEVWLIRTQVVIARGGGPLIHHELLSGFLSAVLTAFFMSIRNPGIDQKLAGYQSPELFEVYQNLNYYKYSRVQS